MKTVTSVKSGSLYKERQNARSVTLENQRVVGALESYMVINYA